MTLSSGPPGAGTAFPKRFYQTATAAPGADGVALLLDGRPARTPARTAIVLPNGAVAQAVADEWNAVEAIIDPRAMPLTRLVNSVIDGVSHTAAAVLEEIQRYAGSDLLVYRAPDPADLAALQARLWDPVLAWARDDLGVDLTIGRGIVFVEQPSTTLERLHQALRDQMGEGSAAPFRLGALHVMTTLTGSALLALAVASGRMRDDEAWAAAHVDEDYQIALWGADDEAASRRARRWIEMRTAAQLGHLASE
jgi:chaperone required for assembly of F1-ATPase